jgi:hypothetical protein
LARFVDFFVFASDSGTGSTNSAQLFRVSPTWSLTRHDLNPGSVYASWPVAKRRIRFSRFAARFSLDLNGYNQTVVLPREKHKAKGFALTAVPSFPNLHGWADDNPW